MEGCEMKHACRYAIVRFMPYPETSEFANVGIVLMSPTAKFFGFQMLGRSARRITDFFDQLEPKTFRVARQLFEIELTRIQQLVEHSFAGHGLNSNEYRYVDSVFNDLLRPQEAMMYLADARGIIVENPAEKLGELFDHYVARDFVEKPNHERDLERRVQQILKLGALTSHYKKMEIGNDDYHTRFPFVQIDQDLKPIRVIKAINLAHADATKLFDHGWDWVGKVKMLKKADILPREVLFAAQRPIENFGPRASAYAEVKHELERYDVQVGSADDEKLILDFANG